MGFWTQFTNSLLNLFLRPNCPMCDRPTEGEVLCSACSRSLRQLQFCPSHRQLYTCHSPSTPVWVWGKYQGQLKRAIASLKYDNHPEIAQPLGQWLGEAWRATTISHRVSPLVIPIPLHPEKLKQRGFNQAERLAASFCQVTSLPLSANGLIRSRQTEAQFGKSADQRHANLKNAFTVNTAQISRYRSSPVLLLDDIYTTGATVQSATQALRHQGISVHGVVAIATTGVAQAPS
ncbi:ComF family protein [Roseofilum sp. BLCC_M154]|jgi:ComF family protein|uniref:ComF family protein n=1 Tax=Roseofilum acuticapitatum BLCC-M154 TaxID=3022444 RepID=A0ABT7AQ71_9CYAN|nr:ComF family protein [Roseofilum acuticapitatum]MDJ1169031.1 ComF family protein [Roseofilum acuticapitatum BLCC-M154]